MKNIDIKILNEITRYKSINNYILEQEAELPPPPSDDVDSGGALPPPADMGTPPADMGTPPADLGTPDIEPQPVDIASDPDVEKVGEEKEKVKEIDITELVTSQKNTEEKQQEYFDNLFKHLTDLEDKLNSMDNIMDKLNHLENKIEKMRPKSAQEKLELRSLDSGPFNQKLTDFFEDKQDDFEKTGREEYILTKDEVENYSNPDVKKSFRDFGTNQDSQFNEVR
jgi:hypothetical protein